MDTLTLRKALQSLSPVQREALTLAHYQGLTQVEIAARTGVPVGTVKTRMFHGLRALRELLKGGESGA